MADCDCGHIEVAHEIVVRAGKQWFAIDCFAEQEVNEAQEQGRVWLWCGHCEDGCRVVNSTDSRIPCPKCNGAGFDQSGSLCDCSGGYVGTTEQPRERDPQTERR